MTGVPRISASSRRLPGSTGMPKCSMVPPASMMPAGTESALSVIAEAPMMSRMSGWVAMHSEMAPAMADASCVTRCSEMMLLPNARTR